MRRETGGLAFRNQIHAVVGTLNRSLLALIVTGIILVSTVGASLFFPRTMNGTRETNSITAYTPASTHTSTSASITTSSTPTEVVSTNSQTPSNSVRFGVDTDGFGQYFVNRTILNFLGNSSVSLVRDWINKTTSSVNEIKSYSQHNITVLAVLTFEILNWPKCDSACVNSPPTNRDWAGNISQVLRLYPTVHNWEIWNEPYNSLYLNNYTQASAESYFSLIRTASQLIHQHNPADKVVCFGGASVNAGPSTGPGNDETIFDWYKMVWSDGAGAYCDAISVHAYTLFRYLLSDKPSWYSGPFTGDNASQVWTTFLSDYESLTMKPIWVTEVGFPSNSDWQDAPSGVTLTPATQAEFAQQALSLLSNLTYVKSVIWFNLYGPNHIIYPLGIDFGLFDSTFHPKPAWQVFESFNLRSNQTVPSP